MVGWILSVGLGPLALLLPAIGAAVPTVLLSSAFPLAIMVVVFVRWSMSAMLRSWVLFAVLHRSCWTAFLLMAF